MSVSQALAGRFVALELSQHGRHGIRALHARIGQHALPLEQKTQEIPGRHGLDLGPQALDGVAMNAREQAPLAPLLLDAESGVNQPRIANPSPCSAARAREMDRSGRQSDRVRDGARAHRTRALEPAAHDLDERFIRGGYLRLEQSPPLGRHPQRPPRPVARAARRGPAPRARAGAAAMRDCRAPPPPSGTSATGARRAARRASPRPAMPRRVRARSPPRRACPRSAAEAASIHRRLITACVRRSSSGASSR